VDVDQPKDAPLVRETERLNFGRYFVPGTVVVSQGGGLGPLTDAEEGLGLEQAVGDEDLDQGAEGDIALPGDEFVDGGGEVESLEVVGDDGQRADDLGLEAGAGVHGRLSLATGIFARFARRAVAPLPPRIKPAPRGAECEYQGEHPMRGHDRSRSGGG
jgi:hypothetical protein